MNNNKPFLSVIIPLYNEEERLGTLTDILKYLKEKKFKSELILVNDGSIDKTLQKIKKMKNRWIKIISYQVNKGKGYAIKTGMLSASGKFRLFMDIDLSTPIEEFEKFEKHLKNFDIVIGSRKMKSSNILIRQPIIREYLGKVFTNISRQILQMKVSDFTCGFKCFSEKAANSIFTTQTLHRWGFDSEILYIGTKKGFKIKEIPISWKNDNKTRVKFPRDIITSLQDLILIKLNDLKGKYS